MGKVLLFWLVLCTALPAQWPPLPTPTEMPGQPFFIKNIWYIGGAGVWDSITLDPATNRLYIAHGPMVQVVNIQTGALAGEIKGLRRAYAIALDNTGQFGYVSDGGASHVVVFNRQSLETVATIDTGPNPRSLVFEPRTHLLFVVQPAPPAQTFRLRGGGPANASNLIPVSYPRSYVAVIDTQNDKVVGEILFRGELGQAETDGAGNVYISYLDRDAILRFNAGEIAAKLLHKTKEAAAASARKPVGSAPGQPPVLDWTGDPGSGAAAGDFITLRLGPACGKPRGFAVDGPNARLFAACGNGVLDVLDTLTDQQVTTLPVGPAVEEVGYDPVHGLIFAPDGAPNGCLTIIRYNAVTHSYNVIQNLPTRSRAYVMAVDPESGRVYLVTDIVGADLTHHGGIGSLRMKPVEGSFQVLEIGD